MKIGVTLFSLIAAAALALAGCGDDDEDAGAPSQRPAGEGGARTTAVELKEFAIEPARLALKRGATLDVQNTGAIAHNLTIERGPDARTPTERLAGTSTFGGGGEERLRVQLPPGRYALVCTVGDHRQQGMVGSLTVR
jgi:plastocyanin